MAGEITHIRYTSSAIASGMKKNEVLNVFQDRKTHNLTSPIHLTLYCYDKRHGFDEDDTFSETLEMRTAILENIVHINHFRIDNFCYDLIENLAWFNYLLQFLQTDHGGTTYAVQYRNLGGGSLHLSLEHVTRLSDAIRLNNNGHIQSFTSCVGFMNTEAFQTIWNALLETGVPQVSLSPHFCGGGNGTQGYNDNSTINFTGLSTNTSVKRLDLKGRGISQHNWRNLFLSIKDNTGLEKLKIRFRIEYRWKEYRNSLNHTELLPCFTEMLRKNNTMIDVEASQINDNDVQNEYNNVTTIETQFNRKWNQYLLKRQEEEEEENASASASSLPPPPAHLAAAAERKRRFKMGCLFHAFRNKQVMRDTVLFHFLSETPDLLIDNDVQQNRVFLNRKRPRRTCGRYE